MYQVENFLVVMLMAGIHLKSILLWCGIELASPRSFSRLDKYVMRCNEHAFCRFNEICGTVFAKWGHEF